ncbi:hypothetical protein [Paenibacillus sp.]|uniref:hypothetical protein n=1 Tax=Paenibacillus sp. TaxID=58172 RepID=UPI0028124D82|nr:hypothetical protein [Paenibacillus sp.]
MKRSYLAAVAVLFGISALVSGCGGDGRAADDNEQVVPHEGHDDGAGTSAHGGDIGVIPSVNGPKTHTTNERGRTSSGMGTSVYSMIGSSGLHEGGVSSHIESRISAEGVEGVEVFVIDDTVILARETPSIVSNRYDALQNEVLSPTQGMSGKGARNEGTKVERSAEDDNLAIAKKQVEEMFEGHVRIRTVTDARAVELIERIQSNMAASGSGRSVAADVSELLELAKE